MRNQDTTAVSDVTLGEGGPGAARPWWAALSEQRWFVIVFVLSALVTSLGLTYVYAEKYESSTAISYRTQEVTRFKAQQSDSLGSPAPQPPFKVIGSTLQEVLKSDVVLRDVVLALRLDDNPRREPSGPWYKVWYESAKEWVKDYGGKTWKLLKYGRIIESNALESAIEELRGNIKISNRDSYIFNLSVRDKSAERAAQIVEHLGKVLAEWLLEFDRQPGRYRAEQLRLLLEDKDREIAHKRKQIETLLTENRVASVAQDGAQLTEQWFALQLEISRLSSEVARSRSRLSAVENKLLVKRRILDGLAGADAAKTGAPAETVENIPPEDFRKLASERVFDDLELKSLVAKRDALQDSADQLMARLRKSPGVQSRYDSLRMALSSVEREHALLNDAYQEAALRATSPISEVRVLHRALVPATPASPIKIYHVLLSLGLGLPLAIGLVYLLDFLGVPLLLAPARHRPDGAAASGQSVPPAPDPDPAREPGNG